VRPALEALDHLIWVTPDLEAGIDDIESRLGVRAVHGGSHPSRGTHNALLRLGDGVYLEILAPDPGQVAPAKPRWLGVDQVGPPRLTTWAIKCDDVAGAVKNAAIAGTRLGAAIAGGRVAEGGTKLEWTVSDPDVVVAGGVVPFLIDWGRTPHPSRRAPAGARLVALVAEHPDAASVHAQIAALGVALSTRVGDAPALIATIVTSRGEIELR
jgi:hypothetical protein